MPIVARPRDRALGIAGSLVAGLLVGAVGTFKHSYGVSVVTGQGLPVGLVLGIAMVAAFVGALRLSFDTRWYAVAGAVGVVLAIALLALPGFSGGSTIILSNTVGTVWSVAPALAVAVVVAVPRRRARPAPVSGGILAESPPGTPAQRRTF